MPSKFLRRFFLMRVAAIAALCAIAVVVALASVFSLGAIARHAPNFTSLVLFPVVAAPLGLGLSER